MSGHVLLTCAGVFYQTLIRRTIMAGSALAVVVSGLSACGNAALSSDADSPSPTTTTTAPRPAATKKTTTHNATPAPPSVFTVDHLTAAMPTEDELPDDYRIKTACPGGDSCRSGDLPNASILADHAGDLTEYVAIGATQYPSAEEAEVVVATSRAERVDEDGSFDIPIEEIEDGYIPGRRGRGVLADSELDGWAGYRLVSSYRLIRSDGPSDTTHTEGYLLLTHGATMVSVQIILPGRASDRVDNQIRTYARDVLDRLA